MNAESHFLSIAVLGCLLKLCPAVMPAQSPMINQGGIVNAADYQEVVAEGGIFSVFGTDLARSVDFAAAMPLPVELRDVSVLVAEGSDVLRAPLFYVSPYQINAQMPYGLGGKSVQVKVKTPDGESLGRVVYVESHAPRMFTKSQDGRGEGVLLHADYSVVSADNPATPGEILLAYMTGLGEVSPPIEAGAAAGGGGTAGLLRTVPQGTHLDGFVNGKQAPVHWAGLAPNFAGLYQVNIQMPADLPIGRVSVIISCGGQWTQASVVMEVRQREQELAHASIGHAGGVISGGGVQVAVAAGAFESETQVSIFRSEEVAPNANGAVYRVSLPESFEAPLTVSLPLREPAPEGRAFLAFRDNGDGLGHAVYFNAEVSGGSVVAQIPPLPTPSSTPQSLASKSLQRKSKESLQRNVSEVKRGYTIWAITGWYAAVSPGGKFEMLFPADDLVEGAGDELLRALDDAYLRLEAIGLSWKGRDSWPLRCILEDFKGQDVQRVAEERPDKRGDNYAQLGFNKKLVGSRQSAELGRTTAGHELFHIMQRLYDPRNRFLKAVSSGPWLWMDEAASTWFERRMATTASYVSSNVRTDPENPIAGSDNYHFLKRGLDYVSGPASTVQDHGYGASMFLEYLSSEHGDVVVGDIIKNRAAQGAGLISSFAYTPAEAIDMASNDVGTAWRRFCEKYMEGSVYANAPPFPGPGEIISGAEIVRFEGQKASHTVSLPMDDLSAQAVVLDFRPDNLEWPEDAELTLSLTQSDSGAMAIVYKRRGSIGGGEAWERAGFVYSDQPMEITGVMDIVGNGYDLVILIANGRAERPYSGAQTVELNVNMQPENPLSVFHKSWQSTFYNKEWTAKVDVTLSTTSSLFGLQETMVADRYLRITAPIVVADSSPPQTDTYTLKVSLEQVRLRDGEISEDYTLVVTGQFDGGEIVEGTSFEKEIQVTRGSTKPIFHDFAVILYYKPKNGGEPFWKAGETLFSLSLQPAAWLN